jgi:hypothetical protein
MSQLTKSLALSAVTVLLSSSAAVVASAQGAAPAPAATGTATVGTAGATAETPAGIDVTPAENPDIGDPGCFMIDQISGFRGRVGGGVQYYGPIGGAYNNFSTTFPQTVSITTGGAGGVTAAVASTETSIKSFSLWLAPSLDYFIVQNLSIGGLFAVDTGFGTYESKTNTQVVSAGGTNNTSTTNKGDLPTVTSFTLMPRVGYLIRINDRLSFWPRVGIGYFSGTNSLVSTQATVDSTGKATTTSYTQSTNVHSLIMQLDVGIIYQITDNVFFRVAPGVAFSSGGGGKVTYSASNGPAPADQSGDGSVFQFELSSGFGANFSL